MASDILPSAPQEPPQVSAELKYRRMLWMGHGCTAALYGDDGEMQCNDISKHRSLDFKRDPLDKLEEIVGRLNLRNAAVASAPQESPQGNLKRKAVANCYMMAKREIARILNGKAQVDTLSLERWQHVLRFCEESGEKSSILRDGLPTEMTEGASAPQESPQERLVAKWRSEAKDARRQAMTAKTDEQRVAQCGVAVNLEQCAAELEALL